jgi:hypothetical protein
MFAESGRQTGSLSTLRASGVESFKGLLALSEYPSTEVVFSQDKMH